MMVRVPALHFYGLVIETTSLMRASMGSQLFSLCKCLVLPTTSWLMTMAEWKPINGIQT